MEVVRRNPDHFSVRYLTTNNNVELLAEQVREFKPRAVAVSDADARKKARAMLPKETEIVEGNEGLLDIARRQDYDIMISALVGFAGLQPTIESLKNGKPVALANKETLVVAGEIVIRLLERHRVELTPIDSEHSAILQCLVGEPEGSVARLILTASGGPFRGWRKERLQAVTVDQALNHPNWRMGSKITIDSATLMNKGLEVIEAHWLFDIETSHIDVVIHPQSIIHSMVEFTDGSVKAQLGIPDMKIPIHYALTYPERIAADYPRLDFRAMGNLTFEEPDIDTFRCLRFAYDALEAGGTAPACLNAANEVAVAAFLEGDIGFLDIPAVIEECLTMIPNNSADSIESIIAADADTRAYARECIANFPHVSVSLT